MLQPNKHRYGAGGRITPSAQGLVKAGIASCAPDELVKAERCPKGGPRYMKRSELLKKFEEEGRREIRGVT